MQQTAYIIATGCKEIKILQGKTTFGFSSGINQRCKVAISKEDAINFLQTRGYTKAHEDDILKVEIWEKIAKDGNSLYKIVQEITNISYYPSLKRELKGD